MRRGFGELMKNLNHCQYINFLTPTHTQEAAVMKIPIPMANFFFFQKVVRDTLKMVPNESS